jgi:hypothetical protein
MYSTCQVKVSWNQIIEFSGPLGNLWNFLTKAAKTKTIDDDQMTMGCCILYKIVWIFTLRCESYSYYPTKLAQHSRYKSSWDYGAAYHLKNISTQIFVNCRHVLSYRDPWMTHKISLLWHGKRSFPFRMNYVFSHCSLKLLSVTSKMTKNSGSKFWINITQRF